MKHEMLLQVSEQNKPVIVTALKTLLSDRKRNITFEWHQDEVGYVLSLVTDNVMDFWSFGLYTGGALADAGAIKIPSAPGVPAADPDAN